MAKLYLTRRQRQILCAMRQEDPRPVIFTMAHMRQFAIYRIGGDPANELVVSCYSEPEWHLMARGLIARAAVETYGRGRCELTDAGRELAGRFRVTDWTEIHWAAAYTVDPAPLDTRRFL